MALFQIPCVGKVITFVVWSTTEIPQIPLEPNSIRHAIQNLASLTHNFEAINEATRVMNASHELLNQESLLHKTELDTILNKALGLQAKVDLLHLGSTNVPLGSGAGLPMRSSDAIFAVENN